MPKFWENKIGKADMKRRRNGKETRREAEKMRIYISTDRQRFGWKIEIHV